MSDAILQGDDDPILYRSEQWIRTTIKSSGNRNTVIVSEILLAIVAFSSIKLISHFVI